MRSLNRIGDSPASLPLSADHIVEFHAARLLLLIRFCGISDRIDGLTKMAKLDFFTRYPDFFDTAAATKPKDAGTPTIKTNKSIESAMVRHHYGPWDKRYYHILAHLEAKHLISVKKEGKSYRLELTDLGREKADILSKKTSFVRIVERMREVKKAFGKKSGSFLKDLIYRIFDEEVSRRKLGEVIRL